MYHYHILHPGGLIISEKWTDTGTGFDEHPDGKLHWKVPSMDRLQHDVNHDVPGRLIERVRVLYDDQESLMFVDENGIARGLEFNPRATYIYHNWFFRARVNLPCDDALCMPDDKLKLIQPDPDKGMIVGTAVLWYKEKKGE